ncbi:MAG: mechanosensitive ion channel family protein [Candidatus Marinimicrobia bacterium]|jgi:small-conductance mechanosensitive channel|nr:mechanosensitive ion channel family protein [Candidatus Neomarinimicrobiota bacterium]MDP6612069.1 mechanosensitive ion channel family protein [Candidatus Neomarinimicrobiota bacterium]|tara:strand:- start:3481 stop:4527 length:1047 start_codon:yes stop_codon:yes gene_type:complete
MEKTIIDYIMVYATPIGTVLVGILLGWLFKRFIHSRLKKVTEKTKWKGDDVVFEAIESHIVLWFFLASLNIASSSIPFISDEYIGYLSKIIISALILSVTMASSRIGVGLLNFWAERQGTDLPSTTIFVNLARIIIISIGVLVILQSLGISITPLLTALGVGGLAVSLALKDTLADFFAGLHILLSQKVKPGDFVEMDSGHMGYVQNITWRHTTLMERTNNIVTIPNSKISAAIVKNYDKGDPSFSIRVSVGVSYNSDLDHVVKVTEEVAEGVVRDVDGAKKDAPPIVRCFEFADSSVNLKIYFRGLKYGDQHPIIDEFIRRIHKRFNQENIEIPFPIRTLIHKNQSE